jgi:hypothetical protein
VWHFSSFIFGRLVFRDPHFLPLCHPKPHRLTSSLSVESVGKFPSSVKLYAGIIPYILETARLFDLYTTFRLLGGRTKDECLQSHTAQPETRNSNPRASSPFFGFERTKGKAIAIEKVGDSTFLDLDGIRYTQSMNPWPARAGSRCYRYARPSPSTSQPCSTLFPPSSTSSCSFASVSLACPHQHSIANPYPFWYRSSLERQSISPKHDHNHQQSCSESRP